MVQALPVDINTTLDYLTKEAVTNTVYIAVMYPNSNNHLAMKKFRLVGQKVRIEGRLDEG